MADLSRTETANSTRARSRSRSRPSSPAGLHRLLSAQFPDDHSVYHLEDGEGVHVDADASSLHKSESERRRAETPNDDSDSLSEKLEKEDEDRIRDQGQETIEEIRGGIPDERDVEAGTPQLEKKKSSRSIKDPNLVSIDICR